MRIKYRVGVLGIDAIWTATSLVMVSKSKRRAASYVLFVTLMCVVQLRFHITKKTLTLNRYCTEKVVVASRLASPRNRKCTQRRRQRR